MDYANIEPFGEYRSELRNGSLMALLANLKRNPEAKREPWSALDFMHFAGRQEEDERELTDEELEAYAREVFGA